MNGCDAAEAALVTPPILSAVPFGCGLAALSGAIFESGKLFIRSSLRSKLQVMKDYSSPESSPGRRAAANWFLDGLPEIVTGLEFAILRCRR